MANSNIKSTALQIIATILLFFFHGVDNAINAYDVVNRWSETQIDGGGLVRGDTVTLRWSVVPDGLAYERSANSQLVQFLDDGWNIPIAERTPDFTNRAWWTVISDAYAQYSRVTGITLEYVAEQNSAGNLTGMVGDIRIGGEILDGTPGGALADNVFPNGGDMRIDTTREEDGSVGSVFSTEPGLRNLVIHETGHGVGLGHTTFINDSADAVMEGGLQTDFWGLQFDDVFGLNILYGDPKERNGGNDDSMNATNLGNLRSVAPIAVGLDAADSVVEQFDDDWLGIRGFTDTDWFRFTTVTDGFTNIRVTPQGPTYETVEQGIFDAASQSDLVLALYADDFGQTLLTSINASSLGSTEEINALQLPAGDYLVKVSARSNTEDTNQFYRLDLSTSSLPEPGSSADLNFDGATDALDWTIFITNNSTDLSQLSALDAFKRGDLDLDGDNDRNDFNLFKSRYLLENGTGSLAGLLVPEPNTTMLLFSCLLAISCYGRTIRVPDITNF